MAMYRSAFQQQPAASLPASSKRKTIGTQTNDSWLPELIQKIVKQRINDERIRRTRDREDEVDATGLHHHQQQHHHPHVMLESQSLDNFLASSPFPFHQNMNSGLESAARKHRLDRLNKNVYQHRSRRKQGKQDRRKEKRRRKGKGSSRRTQMIELLHNVRRVVNQNRNGSISIFRQFDRCGGGTLGVTDIRLALKKLHLQITTEDCLSIILSLRTRTTDSERSLNYFSLLRAVREKGYPDRNRVDLGLGIQQPRKSTVILPPPSLKTRQRQQHHRVVVKPEETALFRKAKLPTLLESMPTNKNQKEEKKKQKQKNKEISSPAVSMVQQSSSKRTSLNQQDEKEVELQEELKHEELEEEETAAASFEQISAAHTQLLQQQERLSRIERAIASPQRVEEGDNRDVDGEDNNDNNSNNEAVEEIHQEALSRFQIYQEDACENGDVAQLKVQEDACENEEEKSQGEATCVTAQGTRSAASRSLLSFEEESIVTQLQVPDLPSNAIPSPESKAPRMIVDSDEEDDDVAPTFTPTAPKIVTPRVVAPSDDNDANDDLNWFRDMKQVMSPEYSTDEDEENTNENNSSDLNSSVGLRKPIASSEKESVIDDIRKVHVQQEEKTSVFKKPPRMKRKKKKYY